MTIRIGDNISSYLSSGRALSKASSKAEYTNSVLQDQFGGSKGGSTKNLAFGVREDAMVLADDGRNSIMSKAVESGDTKEVRQAVTDFVDGYNSLISRLTKNGGAMDAGRLKELNQIIASASDSLKTVGITLDKSGKLDLDKSVLGTAKAEDLQKCFQGEDGLAAKVATKTVSIAMDAASSSGENSIFGNGTEEEDIFGSMTGKSGNQNHQTSVFSSERGARYRARYNNRG